MTNAGPMSEEDKNHSPVSVADVEPHSSDEPLGAEEAARHDSRCRIHVHSVRRRLTDADGISAKAAIDGLVHGGILADDSPQEVRAVTYSQEKGEEETTIITLIWRDG